MQLATINDCIRNIWVFFNWLAKGLQGYLSRQFL